MRAHCRAFRIRGYGAADQRCSPITPTCAAAVGAWQAGAISAEQFLARGYAVIYLHRAGCEMPFARALKPFTTNILDSLRSLTPDERVRGCVVGASATVDLRNLLLFKRFILVLQRRRQGNLRWSRRCSRRKWNGHLRSTRRLSGTTCC